MQSHSRNEQGPRTWEDVARVVKRRAVETYTGLGSLVWMCGGAV